MINQTELHKEASKLYERILEECQTYPHEVSKRELRRSTARWYKVRGAFDGHIKELLEQGRIQEVLQTKASGQTEVKIRISVDT